MQNSGQKLRKIPILTKKKLTPRFKKRALNQWCEASSPQSTTKKTTKNKKNAINANRIAKKNGTVHCFPPGCSISQRWHTCPLGGFPIQKEAWALCTSIPKSRMGIHHFKDPRGEVAGLGLEIGGWLEIWAGQPPPGPRGGGGGDQFPQGG